MLNQDGTKTCPRCGASRPPAGNFYKTGRDTGDGYSGYCIPCTKEKATSWQKALPEDRRRKRDAADWQKRKDDPEYRARQAAAQRTWAARPENKLKVNAWRRAYVAANPDRQRLRNAINNNAARAKRLGVACNFGYVDWCELLERFQHRCAFCGTGECLLDLEHLQPLKFGGAHTVGNVVPACRPCNAQKCAKPLEQFARERQLTNAQLERIQQLAGA